MYSNSKIVFLNFTYVQRNLNDTFTDNTLGLIVVRYLHLHHELVPRLHIAHHRCTEPFFLYNSPTFVLISSTLSLPSLPAATLNSRS